MDTVLKVMVNSTEMPVPAPRPLDLHRQGGRVDKGLHTPPLPPLTGGGIPAREGWWLLTSSNRRGTFPLAVCEPA